MFSARINVEVIENGRVIETKSFETTMGEAQNIGGVLDLATLDAVIVRIQNASVMELNSEGRIGFLKALTIAETMKRETLDALDRAEAANAGLKGDQLDVFR